jgi:hypothetical protein
MRLSCVEDIGEGRNAANAGDGFQEKFLPLTI